MSEESKIIPFPGTGKSPEEQKAERLLALDESEFSSMKASELRALLDDIAIAYEWYGDDSDLEPGSDEWNEREDKMELLDDLSDAIWDLLDNRKE